MLFNVEFHFRTLVNDARRVNLREMSSTGDLATYTNEQITAATKNICVALKKGVVRDDSGRRRPINGDMTKLKYAENLDDLSGKIVTQLEHSSRRIEGTQEVRRIMRFELHSYRVVYGMAAFVTMSPREKDSLLMMRLSRTRRHDPIINVDAVAREFGVRANLL